MSLTKFQSRLQVYSQLGVANDNRDFARRRELSIFLCETRLFDFLNFDASPKLWQTIRIYFNWAMKLKNITKRAPNFENIFEKLILVISLYRLHNTRV